MTSNQNIRKGIVFMVLAVFFFSIMDIAIKWLSAYYSSFQVSFFRGAMSLPFVLLWVFFAGSLDDFKTSRFTFHIVRGALSVCFLIGVVVGLRELTVANAYTFFFAAPLLVAVLSIFFLNEKIGKHRWAAIMVGMLGIIVALEPSTNGLMSYGAAACLLGVIGYSFTVIIIKKLSATESTFAIVFYFLLSITIGCGLLSLYDWHSIQWDHWPVFLLLGVSGTLGQILVTKAFSYAPASVIVPLDYTALIWGSAFAYIIWDEVPNLSIWIGATIIILSGLYLMYRETKVEKKELLLTRETNT